MDGAKTFRSFINFLMAIAATGSIAYFALDNMRPDLVQQIARTSAPASAQASAQERDTSWKLGAFIEKFIDSDRAYLKERGSLAGFGGMGISFRSEDSGTISARSKAPEGRFLRERFGGVIANQQDAAPSGMSLFLPMNEAFAGSAQQSRPVNEAQKPAERASPERPLRPHPEAASATDGRRPPTNPPAQGGFQEVTSAATLGRPSTEKRPVQVSKSAPAPQPAPISQTAREHPALPARPSSTDARDDDADTVNTLLDMARRDIRMAPYALAAASSYRKRYPRDSRSPIFASRIGDLQAALFEAIRERQEIGQTTILTEVRFGDEARKELAACLESSGLLARVVIAAREVRFQSSTPAYMVSLRAHERQDGRQTPVKEIMDAAGPCLVPLFYRGTVSVFHASNEHHALAIKRLEALAGDPAPGQTGDGAPENRG